MLDKCLVPFILPKPFLTALRVTRRGNHPDDHFFVFFSISHFPLKMAVFWRLQGSQNRPKTAFCAKSWLPKPIFWLFFGRSCFCRVFWSFGDRFLMIFRRFFRCIFRCLCLFFLSRRTFKSIGRDNTFSYFQVFWFLHFS